jgi:hypothetical protein
MAYYFAAIHKLKVLQLPSLVRKPFTSRRNPNALKYLPATRLLSNI